MALISKEERQSIEQRVTLLCENSFNGFVVTVLVFAFLNYSLVDNALSLSMRMIQFFLMVSMSLVCLGRLFDAKSTLKNMQLPNFNYDMALTRFSLGLLSNCLIWVIFTLTFVPLMSLVEITLMAIVLSGLAGGAISILGPIRILSSLYVSSLILPFAILGFTLDYDGFFYVTNLAIAFWGVMLLTSKKSSNFISQAIRLESDNTKLLAQIQTEKEALEKSNRDLLTANQRLDTYSLNLQDEVDSRTQEIYRISNLDPLSQLLNRSAFLKFLEESLSSARLQEKQYTLYFIDLNGFKGINDSFGHAHGDSVLSEIAQRLTQLASQKLTEEPLLCRWGGDEFIYVCEYKCEKDAVNTSQEIIETIEKPISVDLDLLNISASLGVALYPEHSTDTHELIQFADLAMYHCKHNQKQNALFYTPDLLDAFLRQQRLRKALSNAVNNDELFLVFQPIIDIEENRTYAFESLIRWRCKGELVSPDEFIPIAEKTGLIINIGYWVINNAIKEFCQLTDFENYKLSINISCVQMLQPDFAYKVLSILNKYPIKKTSLHFEITESTEIQDQITFAKLIKQFVDVGISISIDDFGTGYSSLQQLQALNFDVIKIDRSFIKDMNKKDISIVSAANFIAQQFDAITIVEGVETQAQLDLIRTLGLRYVQGFYFAKPMAFDVLSKWKLDLNKTNRGHRSSDTTPQKRHALPMVKSDYKDQSV